MSRSPFILLCTAGLLAVFSSTISKSPALPLFAAHLGANPSLVGAIAAVSALTGILASIPAGIMSDRYGRRRMLVISGVVFATAPFLYLFVTGLWQLALVRLYHGLATAIFVPVATAYVSGLHVQARGERIGWFSTSTLLGRFMAPAAGGLMLGAFAIPTSGFHAVYLLCGLAGIAALPFILALPDDHFNNNASHVITDTTGGRTGALIEFRAALSNRAILITALVEASILFVYGTFETFLPLYIVGRGGGAWEAGTVLSSQVITLALTKPMMGRFSDRHGRRPQIIYGALGAAVCIACVPAAQSLIPLVGVGVAFGLCISTVTSATSAHIADVSRAGGLGSSMGILGSVMDIGHTTGPLVSGLVAAGYGFGPAFVAAAAVPAVFCVLFVLSPRISGRP